MKEILLAVLCAVSSCLASAQSIVTFDDSIPANWSAGGSSSLSLNNEHLKGGTHALKWAAGAGDTLKAVSLGIASSALSSSSHFFVYSPAAGSDTLIIQFLDNSNVVKREGHMLLNYQGWREYHRNLLDDYNYGSSLPSFSLNGFRIIYRPATSGASGKIWLDEIQFAGYGQARTPGPHMALDHQHFALNPEDGPAGNGLNSWLNTPDIPDTAATAGELTYLSQVRAAYPRPLDTVLSTDVSAAKNYVAACAIRRNADSSITGRPLDSITIYYPDSLVLLSKYCGILARAYVKNGDTDAQSKLLLFTEYLLDQGLAEGGRNVLLTNDYNDTPIFPVGFLQALSVYPPAMRTQVIRMLKWSHEYGKIYAPTITPGLNLDYLYWKTPFLYELACADTSANDAVRDLKSLRRFLEQNTLTGQGGRDGIKPDGSTFHHQAHYVTYMHAFNTWISCAYAVKGTSFRISQTAYNNMCGAIKALFMETSKGAIFPNSDCGRTPFPSSVPVDTTSFQHLVEIGGDVLGLATDPAMAAVYNYVYGISHYTGVSPAALDGYYAFNYAQLGIFRKNGWTVGMRGFTDRLFGAEIYATENRYGRYQSYGATEVLYSGQLTPTGYTKSGAGWDWNVIPGATTVHLPYSSLNPIPTQTVELQLGHFAGAMAMGKNGVFGMDFRQDTTTANYAGSGLHFRKSVFAFDTLLISLGSSIGVTAGSNRVATNLFQGLTDSFATNPPTLYIDSTTPSTLLTGTLSTDTSHWLVTAQKTGFYVAKGNDSISIVRGLQSTPANWDPTGTFLRQAKSSKAWITHGNSPTAAHYQYVIVPNTTATDMKTLSAQLTQGNIYTVLKQTDTVHAVRYIPSHTNAYVFFQPISGASIGYVRGISAPALLETHESGDTLTLAIASPDLNTVTDSVSYWHSSANSVSLTVKGSWNVIANVAGASITQAGDTLTAGFTLQDGLATTLVLVRQGADSSLPGVWTSPADSNWIYTIGEGPRDSVSFSGINKASLSPGTGSLDGYLPNPSSGIVRVGTGTAGNARFDLVDSTHSLQISASSTSQVGKFSGYTIANATPVTSFFFTMSFNNATTDSAEWSLAIGRQSTATTLFSGVGGLATQGNSTAQADVMGALKWQINSDNPALINFKCREKIVSGSNIVSNYHQLDRTTFQKGGSYAMELYCNNTSRQQTYLRGATVYTVFPHTYQVWANGTQLYYLNAPGFPGNELPTDTVVNAFMFEGKNCASLVGGIQTPDNSAQLKIGHTVTVNFGVSNPPAGSSIWSKIDTASSLSLLTDAVNTGMKLMPNPAGDQVELFYASPSTGKATIYLVNMNGQILQTREVWMNAGNNTTPLRTAGLSRGVYTVVVRMAGSQRVARMIKY